MKTIIWKELRENLKWAALAFLCLLLSEIFVLRQSRTYLGNLYSELTLCSSVFLLVSSFGCAIVGAALGGIQILPELRRDQWAALLHRPVPRSAIFFGKVFAGLLLYFLATSLPLLASVVYAATPGQFPGPLVPGMIYPALSDLFLGMAFYFAALLVSLTRGPWYGKRAILAFSVVPLFVAHLITGWPILLPLLASMMLMTAARGAMVSNGPLKDRPKPARLTFVFVMLSGAAAGVLLLGAGILMLPSLIGIPPSDFLYYNFVVTKDAKVFLLTANDNMSKRSLTDMNGTPITDQRYIGNNSSSALGYFSTMCYGRRKDADLEDSAPHLPRQSQSYIRVANGNNFENPEIWYILIGRNYFVGYDKLSCRCIGICDSEGFKSADARPKPFSYPIKGASWGSSAPYLYWSGGLLYGMDFSERSMTRLFAAGSDSIYSAAVLRAQFGKPLYVGVALEKEIQILDLHGTPLFALPYRHDPSVWSVISFATVPSAGRLFFEFDTPYDSEDSNAEAKARPSFVEEIDLQGNLLNTYSRVKMEGQTAPPGLAAHVANCTLPFGPAVLCKIWAHYFRKKGDTRFEFSSFQPPASFSSFDVAIIFAIGVALGVGSHYRARRAGFPKDESLRWAVFVFFFGLPGLMTFRLAADWPARVKCPACFNRRSIETEECPHCHQKWPAPERNGTEIFNFAAK